MISSISHWASFDYFSIARKIDGVERNEDRDDINKAVNNQSTTEKYTETAQDYISNPLVIFELFHTLLVFLVDDKHLVSLNELAVQEVSLNFHQSINLSVGDELGHLDQD